MKSLIFVLPLLLSLAFSIDEEFRKNIPSEGKTTINKHKNYFSISDSSEELGATDQGVPPSGITNFAGMFNERGYYKSNEFSFNEQEIVNDFNGNLMYQIPLYNFALAGDLNFNVSLNYNGSVGHQFILATQLHMKLIPRDII